MSGFKCTGINPSILVANETKEETKVVSFASHTGLKFIPLYSPAKPRQAQTAIPEFSPEEVTLIQKRFAKGFDLNTDARYYLWKEINV